MAEEDSSYADAHQMMDTFVREDGAADHDRTAPSQRSRDSRTSASGDCNQAKDDDHKRRPSVGIEESNFEAFGVVTKSSDDVTQMAASVNPAVNLKDICDVGNVNLMLDRLPVGLRAADHADMNAKNDDLSKVAELLMEMVAGVDCQPIENDELNSSNTNDEVTMIDNNDVESCKFEAKKGFESELVVDESGLSSELQVADQELKEESPDNFIIQRNFIPEHLLRVSGSSSSDQDTDSSSTSSTGSTDDDKSSTSSIDSDDEDFGASFGRNSKRAGGRVTTRQPMKTKGELDLVDLPPIENLQISVDRSEIQNIGRVMSIVGCLVVVQSLPDTPALNLDTVLFFEDGEPLGQIFDVFGPVIRPLYSVRFNTVEDIKAKNILVACPVFYAPKKAEFTEFVFAEQLRRMKGSDASWKNNNEPPEKYLEYSDDEQEKKAKARLKNSERKGEVIVDSDEADADAEKPQKKRQTSQQRNERGRNRRGTGRGRGFQSNTLEGCDAMSPAVSASSYSPTIRPAMFQPTFYSRPPPRFHQPPPYQYPHCRPTFSEMFGHSTQNSYNSLYPTGQFNRPSLPQFSPHLPPPQQPPPPLPSPSRPPPMRWSSPPFASRASHAPISFLFANHNQRVSTSDCVPASTMMTTTSSPSSSVLPNPFRGLSDANTGSEEAGGGETAAIPRFPPVGFVPRM